MDTLDKLGAKWFVRPGTVVLDIGAYVGQTSAAYLDRGAAEVHAFEPRRHNREQIPAAVAEHPAFHLHPYALSDSSGRRDLYVPRQNPGGGTLSRNFFQYIRRHQDDAGTAEEVEVRRLDDLPLPRAAFWKIDVEGLELEVLMGAHGTLASATPDVIQLEISLTPESKLYINTIQLLKDSFTYVWALGAMENKHINTLQHANDRH